MHSFHCRAIFFPRHKPWQVADVRVAIGVAKYSKRFRHRASVVIRARLYDRVNLARPVCLKRPGCLPKLCQADLGVYSSAGGAVGIDDICPGLELVVCHQLLHVAKGLASQLLHVAGDVILVHELRLAGEFEQNAVLLQSGWHIGIANGVGIRRCTLTQHELGWINARHAVRLHVERIQPPKNHGFGLVLRLFFLIAEARNHGLCFCVLQHLHFRADEIPRRYGTISLNRHC